MVDKLLDLAVLQALAAEGGYSGTFTLSDESALVALSSALWLDNLDIWQGEDYELTSAEIDEIQELTANLQYELTTHVSAGGNMEKIGEASIDSDTAEVYIDDITEGDWIVFKLVIQGMLSNKIGVWVDSVEVEINDVDENSAYSTFCRYFYNGAQSNYQILQNYPAAILYLAAAAANASDGIWGHVEITFFNPLITGHKALSFKSTVAGYTDDKIAHTVGECGIFVAAAIQKILIRPLTGTGWLAGGANEPAALTMTLYGLS